MGRSRFFGVRHDRVFGGNDAGADRVGKDLGKLGPEQEDLRRVVYPDQEDNEGTRGPVGGAHITFSQIEPNGKFSDREQQRCQGRPHPHIAPCDMGIGEDLKDHREEASDHGKRDEELEHLEHDLRGRQPPAKPFSKGGEPSTEHE